MCEEGNHCLTQHHRVSDEFKELERLREFARHNEASALEHARQEERQKW